MGTINKMCWKQSVLNLDQKISVSGDSLKCSFPLARFLYKPTFFDMKILTKKSIDFHLKKKFARVKVIGNNYGGKIRSIPLLIFHYWLVNAFLEMFCKDSLKSSRIKSYSFFCIKIARNSRFERRMIASGRPP